MPLRDERHVRTCFLALLGPNADLVPGAQVAQSIGRLQTTNVQNGWHLLDAGVDRVKIKPRTPWLNGKVEPFLRRSDSQLH